MSRDPPPSLQQPKVDLGEALGAFWWRGAARSPCVPALHGAVNPCPRAPPGFPSSWQRDISAFALCAALVGALRECSAEHRERQQSAQQLQIPRGPCLCLGLGLVWSGLVWQQWPRVWCRLPDGVGGRASRGAAGVVAGAAGGSAQGLSQPRARTVILWGGPFITR